MVQKIQKEKKELIISEKPDHILPLKSGYSIEANKSNEPDFLQIKAPDGTICLNIKVSSQGPQVELQAASLSIKTKDNLSLNCKNFDISTHNNINLHSGGDVSLTAKGVIKSQGFSQELRAAKGNISAYANDDIDINGERILLNSPRPPLSK